MKKMKKMLNKQLYKILFWPKKKKKIKILTFYWQNTPKLNKYTPNLLQVSALKWQKNYDFYFIILCNSICQTKKNLIIDNNKQLECSETPKMKTVIHKNLRKLWKSFQMIVKFQNNLKKRHLNSLKRPKKKRISLICLTKTII